MNANPVRLVGYVLTKQVQNLQQSPQIKDIELACRSSGYDLVYMEKEASTARTIVRPGLWRAVRRLICNQCPLPSMSLSLSGPEDWLKSAMVPCACKQLAGLHGLMVTTMESITPNAREGSSFALSLASLGKHLIVTGAQRCVSCCNPSAIALLSKAGI